MNRRTDTKTYFVGTRWGNSNKYPQCMFNEKRKISQIILKYFQYHFLCWTPRQVTWIFTCLESNGTSRTSWVQYFHNPVYYTIQCALKDWSMHSLSVQASSLRPQSLKKTSTAYYLSMFCEHLYCLADHDKADATTDGHRLSPWCHFFSSRDSTVLMIFSEENKVVVVVM